MERDDIMRYPATNTVNLPHPYKLKHSEAVGYWIDGAFGYLFVGYFDTPKECLAEYRKKRKSK